MQKFFKRSLYSIVMLLVLVQSSFALNQVELSVEYIANPAIGRALSLADIYVGIVDLDPKIVGNQKQISVLQENGTTVQVSQPISTSAGGVPLYNGSPVTILVDGSYSLRIDDSTGAQAYYVPKNAELEALSSFDNIADMKAITETPADGDVYNVLGYYASGDGGGQSLYWDATSTETENGFTIFKVTAITTGRFKSKDENILTVRHGGAQSVSDGVSTAQNEYFQTVIDSHGAEGGTVRVPGGTFMLDAEDTVYVRLRDNITLEMDVDAELKAITNALDFYVVLYILDVDNVTIRGGTITGDRDTHTGVTGEFGFGILSRGSSNVLIENLTSRKSWGDGIDFAANGTNVKSSNITIRNVTCSDNSRNGLTLGGAEHVLIENSIFIDTDRTAPMAGIDLEPDEAIEYNDDITIRKCYFNGNTNYGILDTTVPTQNLVIEDCNIIAEPGGLALNLVASAETDNYLNSSFVRGPSDLLNIIANHTEFTNTADFTFHDYVLRSIGEFGLSLNNCAVIATGKKLIHLTNNGTEQYRKTITDTKFKIIGDTLADMSTALTLVGTYSFIDSNFLHEGTEPATGYEVDAEWEYIGVRGRIENTYFDSLYGYNTEITEGNQTINTIKKGYFEAPPTDRIRQYAEGEIVQKLNASSSGEQGWICVEAGRPHIPSQGFLTSGSTTVGSVTNYDTFAVGNIIKSIGLPAGTTVLTNPGTGTITVSNNATVTAWTQLYDAKFLPIGFQNSGFGVWDFDVDGGAIARHFVGEIPDNATITRAWYEVRDAPTSAGAAVINIGVLYNAEEGIIAETAYNNAIFNVGYHDTLADGLAANFTTKTTGPQKIIFEVTASALTAGRVYIYWEYIESD